MTDASAGEASLADRAAAGERRDVGEGAGERPRKRGVLGAGAGGAPMTLAATLRNIALLFAGGLGTAVFNLMRNVLVARLISVEDYGVAVSFGVAMAVLEMMAGIGLNRMIVQAQDGEDLRLQNTLHTIRLVRGIALAVILVAAADLFAGFFGVPELAWAYQLLAIVPLVGGLGHFDIFRAERSMRFAPRIVTEVAPLAISVAVAVIVALALDDWRAMLWAIIAQHVVMAVLSHLFATRPFRFGWDKAVAKRALDFGWPLAVNSLMMMLIFQGDRAIVGNRLGLEALGLFGAAFAITLSASTVMARVLDMLTMPWLAPLQDDPTAFRRPMLVTIEASLALGAATAVGLTVAGPAIFLLLFGPKYADVATLVAWLGLMQGVRSAKAGPAIVSIALGETWNPMIANLPRIAVLPIAYYALAQGADLVALVWIAIAGETMAFVVCFGVLTRRRGIGSRAFAPQISWATLTALTVVATILAAPTAQGAGWSEQFYWTQLAPIAALLLLTGLGLPNLRQFICHAMKKNHQEAIDDFGK